MGLFLKKELCTLTMDAGGQDRKKERKGESEQLSDYRLLLGMTHTINLT